MGNGQKGTWTPTRHTFLKASGVVVAGLSDGAVRAAGTSGQAMLRFGMVTDAHYSDAPAKGSRYYNKSAEKMTECVDLMNEKKVDFLIELGDLKDKGRLPVEKDTLGYLDVIEAVLGKFKGPRYHVLGNHDMDSISKKQFLDRVENTGIARKASYYSFDLKGVHFVVLDANYQADGSDYDHGNFNWQDTNIPRRQLGWLKKDLATTSRPVVVFVHQQLDEDESHSVVNAATVRGILQVTGKVLAVFQGHNHKGSYSCIEGIHYYTLKALVEGSGKENNSYAIAEVRKDRSIVVTGYRKAVGKTMVGYPRNRGGSGKEWRLI